MPVLMRFLIATFTKIFSKLFSLTTVNILGRVPSRDDSKISLIGVLSLYWLYVAFALISPWLDNIAIPFLPNNPVVIEVTGICILVVIPLVIGWILTKLQNYDKSRSSLKKEMLMAYLYTAVLGFLIIALVLAVPIIKAPLIIKRYRVENLKIMIFEGQYENVLEQVESILSKHEIRTKIRSPHKVMYALVLLLVWVLENIFNRDISKQMSIIEGKVRRQKFQITVHSTDISIAAKRDEKSEIMAILSEELDESHLYFSWDTESQQLEDRIKKMQEALEKGGAVRQSDIKELAKDLRAQGLSREEWNSIRREIYKLENLFYKTMQRRGEFSTFKKGG